MRGFLLSKFNSKAAREGVKKPATSAEVNGSTNATTAPPFLFQLSGDSR